jgi:diguanylate cyclase (GGDEF)-like protein/PAS domain S-box-containing protein
LILSVADSEDALRKAETGLAEVGLLASALEELPAEGIRARSPNAGIDQREVFVNGAIGDRALRAARHTEALWSNQRSLQVVALTESLAALSQRVVKQAAGGDLAGARGLLPALSEGNAELTQAVASTRRTLRAEADSREAAATGGMLSIMGVVGVLLVGLMFGVTAARRRRIAGEARQDALRRSEQRLEALVRHGSDMITVVAPDTKVLYQAGAVRSVLGFEPNELEGRNLTQWLHPRDAAELVALCDGANDGSTGRELRFRNRDGSYRTCEARATSLLGDKNWDGIVLNIWDISERKVLEERLRHQAFHDDLTGLPNRALFANRLEHALQKAARAGRSVTVLLVDLDDFKAINDSFGHSAGDALLQRVGKKMGEEMRDADTIARLGGDEFAVIFEGSKSRHADVRVAQRILRAVGDPFEVEGRSFPIAASVGIATSIPGETSADQLIRNADLAMYTAKAEQKKKGWAFFREDMHFSVEGRLQLKADLARAIDDLDQFELYYQPIIGLKEGAIMGFEALLRWNHPTRGRVSPETFIPLAEQSGAIVPLGRWVLREACRQMREWEVECGQKMVVGVNVAVQQLDGPGMVGDVRRALREFGLAGEQLVLELTETEIVHDQDNAIDVLRQIKELGVWIAIDDFGTGYSSLGQLETLSVDTVKIDRHLVSGARDGGSRRKLLRAVTELAEALAMTTVAEGIETPEQLRELKALNIPLGQGFLFSPPVPAAEAAILLRREKVAGLGATVRPVSIA